jgi:hypothetical protein
MVQQNELLGEHYKNEEYASNVSSATLQNTTKHNFYLGPDSSWPITEVVCVFERMLQEAMTLKEKTSRVAILDFIRISSRLVYHPSECPRPPLGVVSSDPLRPLGRTPYTSILHARENTEM